MFNLTTQVTTLGLLVTLMLGPQNQLPRFVPPNERRTNWHNGVVSGADRRPTAVSISTPLLVQVTRCGHDEFCRRLLSEYGAVFVANHGKVLLPGQTIFHSQREVRDFQNRAGFTSLAINKVRIQLQPQAMKAFLASRKEARTLGLDITSLGTRASRRSYDDTMTLWRGRVNAALDHWVALEKLSSARAKKLRSISPDNQVPLVLTLEKKGLYFGDGFRKSILQSVAAPGASQHILMLALDIKQHNDPQIRKILAKHGWFQTVRNDAPHFTYLGVEQARLPALGLRRSSFQGRTVWVADVASVARSRSFSFKHESGRANKKKPAASENGARNSNSPGKVADIASAKKPRKLVATVLNTVTPRKSLVTPSKTTELLNRLSEGYFARSGHNLYITSAYRSPSAQARAMYHNLRAYGNSYVLKTYRRRSAAVEIVEAYRRNSPSRKKAIAAMARVIEAQIHRNVYISRHLRGRAFDVRLRSAKLALLRKLVSGMGGRVGAEVDHYHVEF